MTSGLMLGLGLGLSYLSQTKHHSTIWGVLGWTGIVISFLTIVLQVRYYPLTFRTRRSHTKQNTG